MAERDIEETAPGVSSRFRYLAARDETNLLHRPSLARDGDWTRRARSGAAMVHPRPADIGAVRVGRVNSLQDASGIPIGREETGNALL